jgi:hypothetical protein
LVDGRAKEQNPLRRELVGLGWSCEQLISRVNQRRHQRGASPLHVKTAYPWVRGTRPSSDVIADVLSVLSEYTGRAVTDIDLDWDKKRRRIRTRALDDPYNATAATLVRETQGDPMERRTFGLLSGAAVTAAALDLLMTSAPAMAAAQDGDRVTPQLVGNVERTVRQARELDDSEGSSSTLLWAGGIWQNLGKLITDSAYHAGEGTRLHTAYIEMSETYGWMLFDAGKHPQAQRVYQTGLRLSREADDNTAIQQATANLLASAAYQAVWLGQLSEAGTMLDVATNRKPGALTPRLKAVLANRRVFLVGKQGDLQAIHRSEGQTREHLSHATDGDEPWWSTWLTTTSIDRQTGRALLAAGHPDLAEPYLAAATSTSNPGYPRDRLLGATELANARLRTGDINGACTATQQAVDLSRDVGSSRVHTYLRQVTTSLRTRHNDHPAVQRLVTHPA